MDHLDDAMKPARTSSCIIIDQQDDDFQKALVDSAGSFNGDEEKKPEQIV